jgi:hypothetical protein
MQVSASQFPTSTHAATATAQLKAGQDSVPKLREASLVKDILPRLDGERAERRRKLEEAGLGKERGGRKKRRRLAAIPTEVRYWEKKSTQALKSAYFEDIVTREVGRRSRSWLRFPQSKSWNQGNAFQQSKAVEEIQCLKDRKQGIT